MIVRSVAWASSAWWTARPVASTARGAHPPVELRRPGGPVGEVDAADDAGLPRHHAEVDGAASSGGPTAAARRCGASPSSSACIDSDGRGDHLAVLLGDDLGGAEGAAVLELVDPVAHRLRGVALAGNRMCSDFTDLSGDACGRRRRAPGRGSGRRRRGGSRCRGSGPRPRPGSTSVELEAAEEVVEAEGHQLEPREEQGAGDRPAAVADGRHLGRALGTWRSPPPRRAAAGTPRG